MRSSFYAIKQQQRMPVMTRASFRPHRPVKMSAASSMAGLLSYFGLDEYSRLERKYTREIEDGSSNKDFEANLKDVLKMGILSMKVQPICKMMAIFPCDIFSFTLVRLD